MRNPHHTSQANGWLAKKGLSKNQIADGRFGAKREDEKKNRRERKNIVATKPRTAAVYKKSWESVDSENTEKDTLQPQRR